MNYGHMYGRLQSAAGMQVPMQAPMNGNRYGWNGGAVPPGIANRLALAPNMQAAMQARPGQAMMAQGPGAVLGGPVGQPMPWAQRGNTFRMGGY